MSITTYTDPVAWAEVARLRRERNEARTWAAAWKAAAKHNRGGLNELLAIVVSTSNKCLAYAQQRNEARRWAAAWKAAAKVEREASIYWACSWDLDVDEARTWARRMKAERDEFAKAIDGYNTYMEILSDRIAHLEHKLDRADVPMYAQDLAVLLDMTPDELAKIEADAQARNHPGESWQKRSE